MVCSPMPAVPRPMSSHAAFRDTRSRCSAPPPADPVHGEEEPVRVWIWLSTARVPSQLFPRHPGHRFPLPTSVHPVAWSAQAENAAIGFEAEASCGHQHLPRLDPSRQDRESSSAQ